MEGEADVMDTSERLFTSTDIEDRAQMDNNKDKVQLNIRSPVSYIEDLKLVCPLDWRVIRLKEEISEQFPGNPGPENQKLVYAGRILEDRDRLKSIIRFQDECDVFTIHLVCKIRQAVAEDDGPQLRHRSRPETAASAAALAAGQQQPQQPADILSQDQTSWAQYMQLVENSQPSFETQQYSIQQMAVMQELQSLYFDYYYSHFTNNETLQPHLEIQNIRNRLEEARQALAAAEAAPVDRPVINVGGAAAAVAAAGGPQDLQDEDDLGNRDMLDWLYVSIRILILLSIIYFYSSISRFVLVAAIFIIFYSFQVGFWPLNREGQNIQQEVNNIRDQQQQPAAQQQQQPGPQGEANNNNGEDQAQEAAEAEEAAAQPVPPPQFLDVVFTFLSTFFTSIIPEQIQPHHL